MFVSPRHSFLALVVLSLAASPALARPAHKQALAEYFGPYLPKKLHDCRTCHLPDPPGYKDGDDKPHNVFGARLVAVKQELKNAGKKTTIADRLDAIANEDTDGDGVSNALEILAGRFPGDPNDCPTAAELAEAKKKLVLWNTYRQSYPWRPYEVVQRPAVPVVKNAGCVRNPIDAFISLEHENHGLKPRPEAPKETLLRRVYLDLIGLPPTAEELHAFLADTAPDAYEKVVDRLLTDPRYGERWGRHWMDIWRYSDWAGYGPEVRDSQPHIWRWRDWIVQALNRDKGYDRMIVEMLAGDELAPDHPQVVAATGYLVRNWKRYSREKWLQDTVEHTFMAFLATTIGCARCHDHMYDPLMQREYYQLRAIFEPHTIRIDRVPGQADIAKDGVCRVFDDKLDVKTFLFVRGDDRTPDQTPLLPGVPEALGGKSFKVESVTLPRDAWSPDQRSFVVQELRSGSVAAVAKAETVWKAAVTNAALVLAQSGSNSTLANWARSPAVRKAFDNLALAKLDLALARADHLALWSLLDVEALTETGAADTAEWKKLASATLRLQREAALVLAQRKQLAAVQARAALPPQGDKQKLLAADKIVLDAGKALAKAAADFEVPLTTAFTPRAIKTFPKTTTGRRLALAKWIADKDNPLTARVAVNHIWLRHFGQAIMPSVFDFGRNGRLPSHPALLDWLAAEFMERGWSMKALHRLIVSSSTYRMASTPDAGNTTIDQDNKYLWHYPSRRLEAEAVRDAIFYVAGNLDQRLGGPEIDFPLGLTTPRRSLYFRHAAEKQMEFLAIFDGPSVTESYERKQAIVPQQALALFNSEVVRKHSRLLAQSLAAKVRMDAAAFTKAAFAQVLTRLPTAEELAECTAFLLKQEEYFRAAKTPAGTASPDGTMPSPDPAMRAKENLVHVLFNHHEFVTIR
jgi:hypothetical protein